MPYKQVCVYRSNIIDLILYPNIIANVGNMYNGAYVLVETNGIGSQVVNMLHSDLEYLNIFSTTSRGRGGQQLTAGYRKSSKLGVTMSQPVKAKGCSNLKSMVESNQLIISDFNTIEELSTFIVSGQSYAAEEGQTDDIVISLVLFGWLSVQNHFKDLTDQDLRAKLQKEKEQINESELLPFEYNDGQEKTTFVSDNAIWEIVDEPENKWDNIDYPIWSNKPWKKLDIF